MHSYLRRGGKRGDGRVRAQLVEYARRNTTLLSLLRQAYPDDFALWDRVQRHARPTAAHSGTVPELAASFFEAHPQLPTYEPDCTAGPSCTCSACCSPAYQRTRRDRTSCLACFFSHPECGGLGPAQAWKIPRSLAGARRGAGPWCNTCEACCSASWVHNSGESCEHCAAVECNASSRVAVSTPPFILQAREPSVSGEQA